MKSNATKSTVIWIGKRFKYICENIELVDAKFDIANNWVLCCVW